MKVGINGFGRIGRDVARILVEENNGLELVHINASGDLKTLAHLFRNDSLYGRLSVSCEACEDGFMIDGKKITNTQFRDPAEIPWKDYGVDIVIDSTGAFKNNETLYKHIEKGGAKKVYGCATHGVLSGPAIERLISSKLEEFIITDTIPLNIGNVTDKIKVVSIADQLAKAIERIHNNESISSIFD